MIKLMLIFALAGENDIPRNRSGSEKVDGITYTYKTNSVTGGVDVQNIFHSNYIRTPETPKISIENQKDTGQKIVSLGSTDDIIFTLDGSTPSVYNGIKYTGPIRLDKTGTYKLRAIAIKKRCGSQVAKQKVVVSKNVISEERLESVELVGKKKCAAGKSIQIDISNDGEPIGVERFAWSVNKKNVATVTNGKVTVKPGVESGTTFKVIAKIGDVVKKKKITVK